MPNLIESVRIKGFRSLADVEIDNLSPATVLIGPNGSGKSNFIRFFEMMRSMTARPRRLAEFVALHGGADDQLFGGAQDSPRMKAKIFMRTERGREDYRFSLAHAHPDRFVFTDEAFRFNRGGRGAEATWRRLGSGHSEARIVEIARRGKSAGAKSRTVREIIHLLRHCTSYQFHDTSNHSNLKKKWDVEDSTDLRADGGNLAAILYRLKDEDLPRFESICQYIRHALPIFDRFEIKERYGKVSLRWKSKWIDKTIGAHLTSDGSLRFFALVTLLNLPPEMLPDMLLLDEPELGLHPAAVGLIGEMIKILAKERQVVVATQSPLLVDEFDLDEIVVLELREGRTRVRRFDGKKYGRWLERYSTGQLWEKNLLGGRP